ncbi:glycosyltransferase family 2 protein [Methylophilus flavus]|uniref:Glycosyltransferase family 2 protein n=1 Tax=Methylophilus flavus TaxID=640084 RepID=A0ABW3P963_9PROT
MKVTVYIPTKNRKDILAKAVDSVLNQTYWDIEVIVVSDGSTDDTESYLKQKSSIDNRLKYFIKPNSEGAPAARNLAIKNATGDFITGLDDDDQFLPNRIELLINYWIFLKEHSVLPSCLYTPDLIYRNGKEVGESKKLGHVSHQQLFESNQIGNQIFAPKSVFIDAGLFDEQMPAWQDMEFFYRVLKMFGNASLLDIPTQIVDDTPRADRISIKASNRLRAANERFVSKHCQNSDRHSQMLYLQMFSSFYRIRPKFSDWINFMKHGFWPKGIVGLLAATFRV